MTLLNRASFRLENTIFPTQTPPLDNPFSSISNASYLFPYSHHHQFCILTNNKEDPVQSHPECGFSHTSLSPLLKYIILFLCSHLLFGFCNCSASVECQQGQFFFCMEEYCDVLLFHTLIQTFNKLLLTVIKRKKKLCVIGTKIQSIVLI